MKITFRIICLVSMCLTLTGCDPTKTGGGGEKQTYNSNTGSYNRTAEFLALLIVTVACRRLRILSNHFRGSKGGSPKD